MRIFRAHLESTTPYSQRKYYNTEKKDKETHEDYENRTWRDSMHKNGNGTMVIPCAQFKNCLSESAKFLSKQIPGKGKSTYTKHFDAGVVVLDGIDTGIKVEDVKPMTLMVPSDGVRGGGKRVMKNFPTITSWKGAVDFHIIDETITQKVLEEHLIEAGNLIGVGALRPRRGGWHGRFKVLSVKEVSI